MSDYASFIGSLPPDTLKTIPAGIPPLGVQPNFADPINRNSVILGVSIPFLVLALVCFCIRIYTRVTIMKSWTWDDLTVSIGFICGIVYFAEVVLGSIHGCIGRHLWDVHLDVLLTDTNLESIYVTTIIVTPALCLIKSSFFIQYYLLFQPLRWVRISVWIGATLSTVFYVAVTITAFVLESPWPGQTMLEDMLTWHYLKFVSFAVPLGVIGMLVDWYLFILPIPAIWKLQLSTTKKLGVLIIFMTGGLAAIASVVSLGYRVVLQHRFDDLTWNVSYVMIWAQIEIFAGVAASSMPAVNKFFVHKPFSLASWIPSWIFGITRPSTVSPQHKHLSQSSGFMQRNRSSSKSPEMCHEHRVDESDLEKAGKAPGMKSMQMLLTRDFTVDYEQTGCLPFPPAISPCRH